MNNKIPIIEVFLSLISIWWAIVLFNNDQMLDHVPRQLESLAAFQEKFWASFFMVGAFVKLLGIVTEKKILRKIGLIMSAFLYATISAGFILSGHIMQTQTGVYFALSLLAIFGIRGIGNGTYQS